MRFLECLERIGKSCPALKASPFPERGPSYDRSPHGPLDFVSLKGQMADSQTGAMSGQESHTRNAQAGNPNLVTSRFQWLQPGPTLPILKSESCLSGFQKIGDDLRIADDMFRASILTQTLCPVNYCKNGLPGVTPFP